jgi:hypothetical protein
MSDNTLQAIVIALAVLLIILFGGEPDIIDALIKRIGGE